MTNIIRYFALTIFIASSTQIVAQSDTTIFFFTPKKGNPFYAQIVAIEKGNFITVKKQNGAMQFFQWSEMQDYRPTNYTYNSPEPKRLKQQEEFEKKYSTWDNGFVVLSNHDTLKGKIYGGGDYNYFKKDVVQFYSVGTSPLEIPAGQVDEIYSYAAPKNLCHIVYVAIDEYSAKPLAVAVEGKCQLLMYEFDEVKSSGVGGGMMGPGGMPMAPMMMSEKTGKQIQQYYYRYKNIVTKIRREDKLTVLGNFEDKSLEVFAECPEIISKIKSQVYQYPDIMEVVKEFNECIEKK